MVGKKIGRIKVLSFSHTGGSGGHAYFNCVCDCGKKLIMRGGHLREHNTSTKSCGCYSTETGKIFLVAYATSPAHQGSGNPQWKGNKAGNSSKHSWLTRHFKKEKCEHCKKTTGPFDWALKKGCIYDHKRENFIVLCRSCHLKYDYTEKRKARISVTMKRVWKNGLKTYSKKKL